MHCMCACVIIKLMVLLELLLFSRLLLQLLWSKCFYVSILHIFIFSLPHAHKHRNINRFFGRRQKHWELKWKSKYFIPMQCHYNYVNYRKTTQSHHRFKLKLKTSPAKMLDSQMQIRIHKLLAFGRNGIWLMFVHLSDESSSSYEYSNKWIDECFESTKMFRETLLKRTKLKLVFGRSYQFREKADFGGKKRRKLLCCTSNDKLRMIKFK